MKHHNDFFFGMRVPSPPPERAISKELDPADRSFVMGAALWFEMAAQKL